MADVVKLKDWFVADGAKSAISSQKSGLEQVEIIYDYGTSKERTVSLVKVLDDLKNIASYYSIQNSRFYDWVLEIERNYGIAEEDSYEKWNTEKEDS